MCKRQQKFPVLDTLPVSKPDILVGAAADVLPRNLLLRAPSVRFAIG